MRCWSAQSTRLRRVKAHFPTVSRSEPCTVRSPRYFPQWAAHSFPVSCYYWVLIELGVLARDPRSMDMVSSLSASAPEARKKRGRAAGIPSEGLCPRVDRTEGKTSDTGKAMHRTVAMVQFTRGAGAKKAGWRRLEHAGPRLTVPVACVPLLHRGAQRQRSSVPTLSGPHCILSRLFSG